MREALLAGTSRPPPVQRVEIPPPGGGVRTRGGPTGLDRVIQQAVLQVRQSKWDQPFSAGSSGCRPGRSAHQAVAQAQRDREEGYGWVVDLDLEQVFDRVHHDQRMSRVKERVSDRRVWPRLDRYLKARALTDEGVEATLEGTPPGGPRSPLRTHRLPDGLDQELARRGHRVVR